MQSKNSNDNGKKFGVENGGSPKKNSFAEKWGKKEDENN